MSATANVFLSTIQKLQEHALVHPSIAVGYSGGKDSIVTLDLCVKAGFKEIHPFYLYFIPGMDYVAERMAQVEIRYGLQVIQQPGNFLFSSIKQGLYCNSRYTLDDVPTWTDEEEISHLLIRCGATRHVRGEKAADGLWRKRKRAGKVPPTLLLPIWDWTKYDVLAYLAVHKITPPAEYNAVSATESLNTDYVLWLHDKWPDDYQKLIKWFPYAEAIVKRRDWFGIPAARKRKK